MHKLPPLVELRAFDAAARHMSFKQAALELCVSPTAVSHQIRLLERYCGCALFRRRPRPLTLTDAGARLFPAVRGGLEAFAAAIAAVKRDGDLQPLRVTATNAFASRWLVPRLPAWRKLHPHVPLEVIGTDTVLDLKAGDGDVAIRYATRREVPTDGVVDELVSDTFWPVCSPRLLPAGALKRPADLARQGIGIFSDVLVAPELAAGTLVKAFRLSLPGYGFHVVRRPGHPRESTIRAFSEWLRSVA
jgi:LysR family glycine cleavage system transcriptional activator